MQRDYGQPQVKTFDLGRHARLRTLLLGGFWHDLGAITTQFQPLRHCDDPMRQALLLQWLYELMRHNGVQPTAPVKAYLGGGVRKLALHPPHERTFSQLLQILSAPPVGYLHEIHSKAISIDANGVAHRDTHLRDLENLKMEVRWVIKRYVRGEEWAAFLMAARRISIRILYRPLR
jgi:hypothetical protein